MGEQSNKGVLIGVIAVSILIFGGLVWAILSAPSSLPPADGSVAFDDTNDPFIGPANATTTVHLYSDFQCPACKAAESAVNYAIDKYKDRIKFVWKDFPLMSLHPNARIAADAGRCAQDQGKFWEFKRIMYDQQDSWAELKDPTPSFKAFAKQLGLDEGKFGTCVDDKAGDARVMAAYQEGMKNSVDRTPTVFIDKTRLFGLTPTQWDQELASKP